jgi:hypothetical protein
MVNSAYLGNLVYWVSGVLHSTSYTNWGQKLSFEGMARGEVTFF